MIAKGEMVMTSLNRGTWPQTTAMTYVVDGDVGGIAGQFDPMQLRPMRAFCLTVNKQLIAMLRERDALRLHIRKRLGCNRPVVSAMQSITRSPGVNCVMRAYHFLRHEPFVHRLGITNMTRDRADNICNIILQHRL